jgi:hypothetical protein
MVFCDCFLAWKSIGSKREMSTEAVASGLRKLQKESQQKELESTEHFHLEFHV